MTEQLNDPRPDLATAYDAAADERERTQAAAWKAEERARFLARLRQDGARTLLELGAGPGIHGRWFADQGLAVTATDLSPVMVEHCRAKGLTALQMDMQSLAFATPFDSVFAMNCLLHVPNAQLALVIDRIADALRPGAFGFLGQWTGRRRRSLRGRHLRTQAVLLVSHGTGADGRPRPTLRGGRVPNGTLRGSRRPAFPGHDRAQAVTGRRRRQAAWSIPGTG